MMVLYSTQVLHAQQAGFSAAIVHNMYSETLLNMNYSNGEDPEIVFNFPKLPFSISYRISSVSLLPLNQVD